MYVRNYVVNTDCSAIIMLISVMNSVFVKH